MPSENIKNYALSASATDLGLGQGDVVRQQLEDQERERKKKLNQINSPASSNYGDTLGAFSARSLLNGDF